MLAVTMADGAAKRGAALPAPRSILDLLIRT